MECSIICSLDWREGSKLDEYKLIARALIYLRSYDISDSIADVDALKLLLDEGEVGVDNVVQIVTFSTSPAIDTVGQQLMD